jgi:hypothetical protein
MEIPRKVLHHIHIYNKWTEIAYLAYQGYELQGRGALLIRDESLFGDPSVDILAYFIPLSSPGAYNVLGGTYAEREILDYDPETEIVAVFQGDDGSQDIYVFKALTPPEAKYFINNYLL